MIATKQDIKNTNTRVLDLELKIVVLEKKIKDLMLATHIDNELDFKYEWNYGVPLRDVLMSLLRDCGFELNVFKSNQYQLTKKKKVK